MDNQLVKNLFQYIVQELYLQEAPVTTIRIIKLLYLIDLAYFKKYKKTLTTVEWVRYKYGPYFFEAPEIIRSTNINIEYEEKPTDKGFVRTFYPISNIELSQKIPFVAEQIINKVIKEWSHEDIQSLLLYVYDTAPMKNTILNQPLVFRTIRKQTKVVVKRRQIVLRPETKAKIQSMLKERKADYPKPLSEFYDEEYYKAIQLLNQEDTGITFKGVDITIDQDGIGTLTKHKE